MTDPGETRSSPWDIVVVGGGIAGLTAGLFASRYGHSTLVYNNLLPGGQLLNISHVEDFPGFPNGISGFELCPAVQDQAMRWGAKFASSEVESLAEESDGWVVSSSDGATEKARVVIMATGSKPRSLGIPGEAELIGRGISQCASCDGPIYRDQVVGVVGGGDSAVQETLDLATTVSKVILFHRGSDLTAQGVYQDALRESSRVEVRYQTVIEEVLGRDKVTGIMTKAVDSGKSSSVDLAALFVYIGTTPNSDILQKIVSLDDGGRVVTDPAMRTERPGLLAAGDVRSDSVSHAVAVAGDGATAATAAHRYLFSGEWNSRS